MIETDVLVIGAGPAGSSAARFAAKGGVDVIVLEKKSEIGFPKRCAEGVSKKIFSVTSVYPLCCPGEPVSVVGPGTWSLISGLQLLGLCLVSLTTVPAA